MSVYAGPNTHVFLPVYDDTRTEMLESDPHVTATKHMAHIPGRSQSLTVKELVQLLHNRPVWHTAALCHNVYKCTVVGITILQPRGRH